MLIKGNTLKKADVLTQTGQKLSKIKNILYDPQQKQIVAFITSKPSMMSEAKVIPFNSISKVSPDAVLVDSKSAEKKASELGEQFSQLTKDKKLRLDSGKIVSEQATEYGSVSDVFLDTETGKVIGFELSQGTVKDMKEGKKTMKIVDIVSVGEDAIIVRPQMSDGQSQADVQPNQKQKINETPQSTTKPKMNEQRVIVNTPSLPEAPDPKIVQDAIGKYIGKHILTQDDVIFAKQGQIITHELVQSAYSIGVLEDVISNATTTIEV